MESRFKSGTVESGLEEMVRQYKILQDKMNGTEVRRLQEAEIAELFRLVHENILPRYADNKAILHRDSRPVRTFETELQRLWSQALFEFVGYFRPRLPEFLTKLMAVEQDGEAKLQKFMKLVLEGITIPLLKGYDLPGDDLFFLILHTVTYLDEESAVNYLADTLETPPQTQASVFAVCGLLIQARTAADAGEEAIAYSYLIDASYLLGMSKSSAFITKRFDAIAAKRQAKANAKKRHSSAKELNLGKKRVAELYYSLRSTGENGVQLPWKSANKALEEISQAIAKENNPDIRISDTTIRKICLAMQKRELKERKRQGINLTVSFPMPDGSTVTFPAED